MAVVKKKKKSKLLPLCAVKLLQGIARARTAPRQEGWSCLGGTRGSARL